MFIDRGCASARRAVRFYQRRYADWRDKMGAGVGPTGIAEHRLACPRYLAHVLQRKSYAARKAYEHWWHERGQVVERLNRGLAHAAGYSWMQSNPMRGTGAILEREGRRYGVSPYFMAAAAATESSLGIAACGYHGYNAWGLANCDGSWGVPTFHSWDEAIAFYARFLSSRWPSHSTPYSFTGYAACDSCWANKVSQWMHSLFGVRAWTRYP